MHQDKKRTKGGSLMRGLGAALLLMLPAMVFAQDAPPPPNKGDVSWLMTSTVLVILMTIPGLALFYGGMVRSKNVLSLLMQVMIVFCVGVLLFAIYGYSMAFSEGSNQFFGGFGKIFLKGMTGDSLTGTFSKATNIPELGFFCFQATFAAITPALIVGAFAERIKFSALLVFIMIWLTFAYYPIAHMVWFWAGPDAYTTAEAVAAHPPTTASCSRRAHSTSRAAPWCTSTPASQASSAACWSASASATARPRCRRTTCRTS